jgi:hypothetical protein
MRPAIAMVLVGLFLWFYKSLVVIQMSVEIEPICEVTPMLSEVEANNVNHDAASWPALRNCASCPNYSSTIATSADRSKAMTKQEDSTL